MSNSTSRTINSIHVRALSRLSSVREPSPQEVAQHVEEAARDVAQSIDPMVDAMREMIKAPSTPQARDDGLLTVDQVAKRLGVARSTVYVLMEQREIRFIKIGRARRLDPVADRDSR